MSEQIYVKPAAGLHLRDEYTFQPIPPEGQSVKRTTLVDRRINRGELMVCDAPAEVADEPTKKSGKHAERFADKAGE